MTSFKRTREMVENRIRPGIEMLQTMSDHPDIRLQLLRLEDAHGRLDDLFAAAEDTNRKVALFEFGLTPQLFYAFDCAPLCLETFPMMFTAGNKEVFYDFIEKAESSGLPSDVCSTDRFIMGAALSGEFPENACFVTCSAPCDGTRLAYPVMQQATDIPTLFLEAPYTYGKEAAHWYGQQIKRELIPFLEEVTGKTFDLEKFRRIVEESNRAYELLVDISDAYTMKPSPLPASLRGFPYMSFIGSAGHPRNTKNTETFHREVYRRIKAGITNPFEEKHRVMWGHVPPTFDSEFFTWMETELGACVITSMLASSPILRPIDTTDLDTMLEGYAWQGLDLTMSLMRYDTRKLIEYTMNTFHQYRCDCMIFTLHVGCNSICGAAGIMRRYFQKEGIPVLFIELDYNDDRVLSAEPMREQIEDFFATINA
ncbi:MAG: 2-hydroxyacyl-CoA dehydratase family protein [Desulfobacterales bacterium]